MSDTKDCHLGAPWSYWILSALQSHAPDGPAQRQCAEFYSEMQREGLDENEMQEYLAGALHDGLRHGNWVWTQTSVNPITNQPEEGWKEVIAGVPGTVLEDFVEVGPPAEIDSAPLADWERELLEGG
jgi:hypothetical protein